MPTLPGLSLLLDDDHKVQKTEPSSKVEPRKSFEQWKQQHKAIFIDNVTTTLQRKAEKKQVRFESDNKTNFISNDERRERPTNQQIPPSVSPHLELSYYEGTHERNVCQNQRYKDYQQYSNGTEHCDDYERNVLLPRCNFKPARPSFATDKACNHAANEKTLNLAHFKQTLESEPTKDAYRLEASGHNDQRQSYRNCCPSNQNHWEMMNYQTCSHGMQPKGCVSERQVHQSHQHEVEHSTISPFSKHVERDLKGQLTDDTLLSIMEEQQQHILLQQNQILMQQKQNMMQQNQIFMLQRQVQQLLLRNGTNPIESPGKMGQTTSIRELTAPRTTTNALQNAIKMRNTLADSARDGTTTKTKSSVGVMTSFIGNVNDAMPNGLQQFNEKFSTKLADEKFIENRGVFTADEYSHKDSMLDKINDAIKNSSAMIDYRNNSNGTGNNGCASPNRQSDINIAAQA